MKHLIKIETTEHGALSVSHMGKDQQWCEAGLSVRVNNQPDAGWGLQKLYYVVAGSSEKHPINITTRTFIMPNGNVTIGGVFKRFVIGDWTEGKQPNVGHVLAVGQDGEPVPTEVMVDDITPKAVNVTHAELEELVRTHALAAGTWYRITDYVATTTQEGTRSANHPFDIIVRADSDATLNENAFAAQHEGDSYFDFAKINSWRLKYDLHNEVYKYAWADDINGKGVIYRMCDEWGNEAAFDFKGIVFERSADWFSGLADWCNFVIGSVPDESKWMYLFTWVDDRGNVLDLSLTEAKCMNNKVGNIKGEIFDIESLYALGDTIFVNTYYVNRSLGDLYGVFNNTFGNNCYNNTFGNNCYNNTFGNDCYDNIFGNDFYDNIFGNDCNNNTFGNNCYNNTFGINCYNTTLGNDCNDNTFGNDCYNNTFGDGCYNNIFGNDCYINTFGDGCYNNILGNDCNNNTFGDGCYNNTFGNSCRNITFGDGCYNNTFGDSCYNNTFGDDCYSNTIILGVFKIVLGDDCVQNTFNAGCSNISATGAVYKNIVVLNGTTRGSVVIDFSNEAVDVNADYCQFVTIYNGMPLVWAPHP